MNIYTHIPYTYRIKNKTTGLQYYGVRFAKNCHPDDLWVAYFTSSKHVKKLIEKHGKDDFEIRITRIFPNNPGAAISWEDRIVKRLLYNPNWLNYNWRGSIHPKKAREGALKRAALVNGGFFYTDGTTVEKFMPGEEPNGWIRYKKEATIKNPERGTKGTKWYHNLEERKRICIPKDADPPLGYVLGKGPYKFDSIRAKRFWYNNGIKEGQFELGNEPYRWNRGRLKSLTSGSKSAIV